MSTKPLSSFPPTILKDLSILKVDKENKNFKIIGSASYRAAIYPSDFDCFEIVTRNSLNELISDFKKRLQEIVHQLINTKHHFFMEVKMGIDNRYDIDIGSSHNNVYVMNPQLPRIISLMHKGGLFSDDEFDEMAELMSTVPLTQLQYEKLKAIIRKRKIIRWTSGEIRRGYKILPMMPNPFTMEEAIMSKSKINIELISIVDGKLLDESNFFYLMYLSPDGQKHILNLTDDILVNFRSFFSNNLKESIEQLAYSKLEYNPLKVAKRMFSLARFTNDRSLFNKVVPIINSKYAYAYQLKSEIATMLKLINTVALYKIPKKILKKQLMNIKYRLANVLLFTNDQLEVINHSLDGVYDAAFDAKECTEILEIVKSTLISYVNDGVAQLLREASLLPIPKSLLPERRNF
jgi:hypothetical protein